MLFTRIELAEGHGRTSNTRLSKRRSVSRLYIHSVIRLRVVLLGGVRSATFSSLCLPASISKTSRNEKASSVCLFVFILKACSPKGLAKE
jgi:hypothetical protein